MTATITERVVKPFLMDLESESHTFLNGEQVEPARYYELLEKDILRFGDCEEEYVVMSR